MYVLPQQTTENVIELSCHNHWCVLTINQWIRAAPFYVWAGLSEESSCVCFHLCAKYIVLLKWDEASPICEVLSGQPGWFHCVSCYLLSSSKLAWAFAHDAASGLKDRLEMC